MADDDIEDMGFLAEEACRELARAIYRHSTEPRKQVHEALRRFMHEAKKGRPNA